MADDRPTAAPVFRLEGVSVVRNGTALLDDIWWEVGAGQRWALLGPNGSGKTTLLRVVGSSLWPTRGVVELLGEHDIDCGELRAQGPAATPPSRRGGTSTPMAIGAGPPPSWPMPGSATAGSPSVRSGCCPRANVSRSSSPGP
jgi:iron complex transport system ATP-binding protein